MIQWKLNSQSMKIGPFLVNSGQKEFQNELDYDYNLTLHDIFEQIVEKYPDYPAIWYFDTWITYSQLKKMVDSMATALYNMGVKKGDVVAIHLPNSIQYVVSYYAIASIGGIITGINPTYKSQRNFVSIENH